MNPISKGVLIGMALNPYMKYKQQSVMTMTQGEMVVKLYDELIKQLNSGCMYIEKSDIGGRNTALQKAQRIINHFRVTLNFDVAMSKDLDALYDYFISRVIAANVKSDAAALQEILPMVEELRDTFSQAERRSRAAGVS